MSAKEVNEPDDRRWAGLAGLMGVTDRDRLLGDAASSKYCLSSILIPLSFARSNDVLPFYTKDTPIGIICAQNITQQVVV
jgi:hypothetical protein